MCLLQGPGWYELLRPRRLLRELSCGAKGSVEILEPRSRLQEQYENLHKKIVWGEASQKKPSACAQNWWEL